MARDLPLRRRFSARLLVLRFGIEHCQRHCPARRQVPARLIRLSLSPLANGVDLI